MKECREADSARERKAEEEMSCQSPPSGTQLTSPSSSSSSVLASPSSAKPTEQCGSATAAPVGLLHPRGRHKGPSHHRPLSRTQSSPLVTFSVPPQTAQDAGPVNYIFTTGAAWLISSLSSLSVFKANQLKWSLIWYLKFRIGFCIDY